MPIYAFQCRACGHQFDRLQKLSDPDPENCPVCGEPQIHRQVTAPSFRLAGSGWYETDFKKDGDKKRNLADKGTDKGADKPAAEPASKSESPKPASKPESGKPGASPPAPAS